MRGPKLFQPARGRAVPGTGSAPPTREAGRYQIFAVVGLALLVSSMQGSMVSVALPDVIDSLNAPLRWVGWIVSIFTLAQAVSMPITGKLSDELGRRTVFVGGLIAFALASLGAALAPNVYWLIGARALQGLAGGSLLPSAYGIVGDAFQDRRAQAIGLISSIFPIGSIIGPTLGGIIVEHFGWRWTFALNAPLVAGIVCVALFVMPASKRRQAKPIDGVGAALLSLAVIAFVYAITELSQRAASPNGPLVAISLLVSFASAVAFLRHESKVTDPLLDLALLRRREFAFMNTLNFFYGAGVFGLLSFMPLYAQTGYGMSHAESGALLTPRSIAMIGASSLAALMLPRTGYRKPIVLGLATMALSLFLLSRGLHDVELAGFLVPNFLYLSVVIAISGFGFGVSGPAANNAAIELAPDRIAAITGLRGMFRSLGGTLGTAFIVLVTSRAETEARGLEIAFVGLAGINLITMLFVFGIPDGRSSGGEIAAVTPAGAGKAAG